MKQQLTLCVLCEESHVLLGMKKRGFGAGKWNGFGGKVDVDETLEDAACREMKEESGINVSKLEKAGELEFSFIGESDILHVHVFRVLAYTGSPVESEEMRPAWFRMDSIPYDTMWADDPHWLPLLIAGKKFKGACTFQDDDTLCEVAIREVMSL